MAEAERAVFKREQDDSTIRVVFASLCSKSFLRVGALLFCVLLM